MNTREINYHIARLVADCQIFRGGFCLRSPSRYARLLSELVCQEVYEEFTYENSHSTSSLSSWLFVEGIWTQEDEKKLNVMKDDLNKLKMELYRSNKPIIRKAILNGRRAIAEALGRKHQYDRLTSEWAAYDAKEKFLVGCGLYKDKKKYWRNPLEDWRKPDQIVDYVYNTRKVLSEEQVRAIAKSNEWKSYSSVRGRLIDRFVVDMSEELRDLITWTDLYASILKHPEAPIQTVIDDDDRIDGWLLVQQEKNKKARLEEKREKLLAKHGGAGEIYVIANEADEDSEFTYDEIMSLNDENARRQVQQRNRVVQEKGKALDTDFQDVQQRLRGQ
jgi:hypothetical protein